MSIRFCKLTGAGNDFIAVNNMDGSLDGILDAPLVADLCRRAVSIGADGLLELRPSGRADFRMVYYNKDGGRASMCGNGGRCIARFALMEHAAGSTQVFESDSGLHRAEVSGAGTVRLWMTDPVMIERMSTFSLHRRPGAPGPDSVEAGVVDTGVPHMVVFRDDLLDGLFEASAASLRQDRTCVPDGANVDFVRIVDRRSVTIRTWERGVEGETLACGTGAVAAVFLGSDRGFLDLPCGVMPEGGSLLEVGRDGRGWWLEGEARPVYSGETMEPRP